MSEGIKRKWLEFRISNSSHRVVVNGCPSFTGLGDQGGEVGRDEGLAE